MREAGMEEVEDGLHLLHVEQMKLY